MKHTEEAVVLAREFSIAEEQARHTIDLLDEGNTVPFIARYRKDATGGLSDDILRDLSARLDYLRKLNKRVDEIYESVAGQDKMTPELEAALEKVSTLQEAETLYLPFKRKKHTRAMQARERGLEPLAVQIMNKLPDAELEALAANFVDPDKDLADTDKVLAGAMDIVAEELSENAELRKALKKMLMEKSLMTTSVTPKYAAETTEFMDYYQYSEPVAKIPDHRILAINRGEKRDVLNVGLTPETEQALAIMKKQCFDGGSLFYEKAAQDAYKRLIFPALEREIRSELRERAEGSSIRNFAINLKKLLLQYPFKGKTTLGFDPGYRNGCKIAVLDPHGTFIDSAILYPPFTSRKHNHADRELLDLIERNQVDLIALGNGTASRESEQFICEVLKDCPRKVQYMIVNEAGASIYSASKLAAEEYPDLDVSIRGAISIAGRLQDPLSELIKIEPKHLGIGQYQHDVNQKELTVVLDNAVEDAVSKVGADLNRASAVLLSHIAGVSPSTARNIVSYREEHGGFRSKEELKKVRGIGQKAFEQCAGFLRVPDADDVLDRTGIHPESYPIARKLLKLTGLENQELIDQSPRAAERLCRVSIPKASACLQAGPLTIIDILNELKKPGQDPRDKAVRPELKSDVLTIADLECGMELNGTVRNVVDFGAFVDIGVHQDGLVHISQMSNKFVSHPSEILSVGDIVRVRVIEADTKRGRIGLSMLPDQPEAQKKRRKRRHATHSK